MSQPDVLRWSVTLPAWALVVVASCVGALAGEPGCVTLSPSEFPHQGACVGLAYDPATLERTVSRAAALWGGCGQYSCGFPELEPAGSCPRTVTVRLDDRCSAGPVCGSFEGREITLYRCAITRQGRRECGDVARVLAHELGHVLGLDDAPPGAACQHYIMASAGETELRYVQRQECALADAHWITPFESAAPGDLAHTTPNSPEIRPSFAETP